MVVVVVVVGDGCGRGPGVFGGGGVALDYAVVGADHVGEAGVGGCWLQGVDGGGWFEEGAELGAGPAEVDFVCWGC